MGHPVTHRVRVGKDVYGVYSVSGHGGPDSGDNRGRTDPHFHVRVRALYSEQPGWDYREARERTRLGAQRFHRTAWRGWFPAECAARRLACAVPVSVSYSLGVAGDDPAGEDRLYLRP